jgi:glycine betaine/choline ABC-type transport system substrate-binding protein
VLQDDKHYFPPYDAVPIVRADTLASHPAIASALRRLGGVITENEMRKMNYAVDGEKKDPAGVVTEFLSSKHLL